MMEHSDALETTVVSIDGITIKVIKKIDDPICVRISAGGTEKEGLYLVYRGNIDEVKQILRILNEAVDVI